MKHYLLCLSVPLTCSLILVDDSGDMFLFPTVVIQLDQLGTPPPLPHTPRLTGPYASTRGVHLIVINNQPVPEGGRHPPVA